ncbi:MAG: excinuclease ABC subunit UvrC [Patescibacteria group bacterium]
MTNLYPHTIKKKEKRTPAGSSSFGVEVYKNLPQTPGVYIMKGAKGEILYVGKAVNLRRRVSSYFLRSHDYRLEKLVSLIKKIDHQKTDTGLEALILESELIKKHQPPYNVLEKDDKSFLYVEITKEKFPRVLLIRGKDLHEKSPSSHNSKFLIHNSKRYGPFTSSSSLRKALKIIRRIFPYSTHDSKTLLASGYTLNPSSRPCFDFSIGLCPGTCIGAISQKDYAKTIRNIKLFFSGKKHQILKSLEKEMKQASKELEFEKAEKVRRQIFALKHIEDTAFISDSSYSLLASGQTLNPTFRIEGYDISNISGTSAVGSMVVFVNRKPDKNEYRKFKIKTVKGPDDTGMLREVLSRRFEHKEWPFPNLILIDGGAGQVNAAKFVLAEYKIKIPVFGIAKGPERKRNDIIGILPKGVNKKTLIQVRDEAHRFAVSYHRKLRSKNLLTLR